MKKRSEQEMYQLILSVAKNDPRIRAVLLNGSRANPQIEKDQYQDYDIIFWVRDLESFSKTPNWVDIFGERIIMQMPNNMQLHNEPMPSMDEGITYLMLFTDANRIDLSLLPVEKRGSFHDSLTQVLLDKDHLYPDPPLSSDQDYWIRRPSPKQFIDCCNEFWWVSTYVMKGLLRQEIIYAKEMLENPVRKMFLRMLAWHIGMQHHFSISLGNSNKFLKKYVDTNLWNSILNTYPDAQEQNIRKSFKEMIGLFHQMEMEVATFLDFDYNSMDSQNVRSYLKDKAL